MAFTPGSNDGQMNGAVKVTVVAAPASGKQRMVKTITIFNRDSSSVVLTLMLTVSGTDRYLDNQTLAAGASYSWTKTLALDATTKSIRAMLAGAVSSTQPDFTAHYADAS